MLVEIGIGERIDCGIGRRRAPDGALAPIIRVVLMAANASSTRRTAHGLSWIRADRTALRVMTATSTAVKTGAPSGVPRSSAARRLRDMVWQYVTERVGYIKKKKKKNNYLSDYSYRNINYPYSNYFFFINHLVSGFIITNFLLVITGLHHTDALEHFWHNGNKR